VTHYAVTAVGADRPGIVAALTGALYELDCNLEDVSSTILRGTFAVTLVVRAAEGLESGGLSRRVDEAVGALGVSVSVREVDSQESRGEATDVLIVYGSDRPGIVARVTRLLAERGANITDLSCRLTGAVYSMVAEVTLPDEVDRAALAEEIRGVGRDLGVDVTFRPVVVETL